MALIVETGALVSGADSFVTVAEYAAYVAANVKSDYSGTEATQEVNLRRAAQYLDRNIAWVGMRQYKTQALPWPRLVNGLVRDWPVDPDTVPQAVKDAQCELAYQFEADGIDPYEAITDDTTRVKVGPIEVDTLPTSAPRMVVIEGLLGPYRTTGGGQVRMVRG